MRRTHSGATLAVRKTAIVMFDRAPGADDQWTGPGRAARMLPRARLDGRRAGFLTGSGSSGGTIERAQP